MTTVTAVTAFLRAGAVCKTSSRSSRPSRGAGPKSRDLAGGPTQAQRSGLRGGRRSKGAERGMAARPSRAERTLLRRGGGDCRKAIQPEPLDFWPTEDTGRVGGKAVPFPPAQRRVSKFRRGAGCPFQRAALLGELSADGGGNAPTPPRRAQMRF